MKKHINCRNLRNELQRKIIIKKVYKDKLFLQEQPGNQESQVLLHGVRPAADFTPSLPSGLHSRKESFCCPSWRNQIPPWEIKSIPMNYFWGGYKDRAWQGFPLATAQEPPQSMSAQRKVENLTYRNCFSLECKDKLKAFRKPKVCYKAEASAFPSKATISNSDTTEHSKRLQHLVWSDTERTH